MNRRHFLAMLSSLPFAESLGKAALAQTSPAADAGTVRTARVLTGRADLAETVIARATTFQIALDAGFEARLKDLVAIIGNAEPGQRESVIAGLSDANAKTAIELISPLYLGYTGSPSAVKAVDNARFVTFLDALMYEPTADNSIRPSYARGGPNYWTAIPADVRAPKMADNILEWGNGGPRASSTYAKPDARYLALCQGHGKTLAEAEAWLASNPKIATSGDQK